MNPQAMPTPQSIEPGLLPHTVAELRPYVGIADKEDSDVSSRLNEILKKFTELVDSVVMLAIEKHNIGDFQAAAYAGFNVYLRVLRAKSDILQAILKNDAQASIKLVQTSLNGLEFDFRENAVQQFGTALAEQADFTIWTRRKTAHLVWQQLIDQGTQDLSNEAIEHGKKLLSDFAVATAWSQFHVDCLYTAMRLKRAIYPDVAPAIVEGLRMEVNAYALAKQLIDLYLPPSIDEELKPYVWSDEDEELLASSMDDMESEQIEKY